MLPRRTLPWIIAFGSLSTLAHAAGEPACDSQFSAIFNDAQKKGGRIFARFNEFKGPDWQKHINEIRDATRRRFQYWHGHEYPIMAMDDATPVKASILARDAYSFNTVKRSVFDELTALKALDDPAKIKAGLDDLAKRYAGYPAEAEELKRASLNLQRKEDLQAAIDDFMRAVDERQTPVFTPEEVKRELNDLLRAVEAFPDNYLRFIDETATQAAQYDEIVKILSSKDLPTYDIKIQLPMVDVKPDGSVAVTMKEQYFDSLVQLKLYRDQLKKEVEMRTAQRFFTLNLSQNAHITQAINFKKLENYRNALRRQATLAENAGKSIPPELQSQLDRINALYEEGNKLKEKYRLPYWAWDRLRWVQLWGETRSFLEKDIPKLQDKIQNDKVIQYLSTMPEEERRAIGISDNIASSASILGRTKVGGLLLTGTTTAGPFYGTYQVLNMAYAYAIGDRREKEKCANILNDDDFISCAQDYLQTKFPQKAIKELVSKKMIFTGQDGEIADPKVSKEVKDMIQRRLKFQDGENFKANAREVLGKGLEQIMGQHDMSSVAYRKKMVESKSDDVFRMAVTGASPNAGPSTPKVRSYLEFRFPVHYPKHKDAVAAILKQEYNSDAQNKALEDLRTLGAATLADEVKMLLDERQTFKDTGAVSISDPDLSAEQRRQKEEEERKRREEEDKKKGGTSSPSPSTAPRSSPKPSPRVK